MKKLSIILPLALILCFVVGCQDKEAMAELEAMKAQAEVEEQNEALVRRVFEELTNHSDEIYQEAYAPEYGWYFPSNNPKPLSREEEYEFVKATWTGFPDLYYKIEELIAKDDRIVVRFTGGGTHKGEWQGIPATGDKVEGCGIWMARKKMEKLLK